jgi:SAM-dependent methyltransferase
LGLPFSDPDVGDAWCERQLLLRTLQIDEGVWNAVIADYERVQPPLSRGSLGQRLEGLREAFARRVSHGGWPANVASGERCPVCGGAELEPVVVRRPGPSVWARCVKCAHGTLVSAGEDASRAYRSERYYAVRDASGVGYDDYGNEAAYREEKGRRLIERVIGVARGRLRSLLEVGSGFGYTRAAAERLGLETAGVDLNPHAAVAARRKYGFETFTGSLEQALENPSSGIERGHWDLVSYQFVLEHIADLARELRSAREALQPGGWLSFLVPSFEAAELDVFGGSYRSLRADHLHLFSSSSVRHVLERTGFVPRLIETGCNLHLLRGFLSAEELRSLYAAGRGPDLLVVAESLP